MKNAPPNVRTTTIVHDSIVEPLAYTDVGTLFSNLHFGSDTLGNIGVGSSTIGRPSGDSGTAVVFDDVDRGEITNNIIENEIVEEGPGEGDDVLGTGVLVQGLLGEASEFTIKHNTIKGGDVGIQVGPFTGDPTISGLITKNMIVGDDPGTFEGSPATVGILCDGGPNADITIRKNNTVIGYDTLIAC